MEDVIGGLETVQERHAEGRLGQGSGVTLRNHLVGHVLLHHDGLLHDLDSKLLLWLVLPVAEEDLPEGPPADGLQDLEVIDGRGRAGPGGRPGRRRVQSLLAKLECTHLTTPTFASPQLLNQ